MIELDPFIFRDKAKAFLNNAADYCRNVSDNTELAEHFRPAVTRSHIVVESVANRLRGAKRGKYVEELSAVCANLRNVFTANLDFTPDPKSELQARFRQACAFRYKTASLPAEIAQERTVTALNNFITAGVLYYKGANRVRSIDNKMIDDYIALIKAFVPDQVSNVVQLFPGGPK